ncbi:histone-fold-containing protein, partial [Corynespora cassiicola Philippines]
MPYNNTPIAPSQEVSGQVSLPLARVQKIINADPERLHTSKNAAFAIALATEMFIQHLATTTHNVVKAERKPRRNIQYRDVSTAVAKTDNLEFLVDVVPKTMTFKEFKKKQ